MSWIQSIVWASTSDECTNRDCKKCCAYRVVTNVGICLNDDLDYFWYTLYTLSLSNTAWTGDELLAGGYERTD